MDENQNKNTPSCAVEYMYMIWAIGCDYDGCNDVESLKKLIDEIVLYSERARGLCYEGRIFPDYDSVSYGKIKKMVENGLFKS